MIPADLMRGRLWRLSVALVGFSFVADAMQQEPQKPGVDRRGTAIVIASDPASYALTTVRGGVKFDIDGDGTSEQVAWTAQGADVAFLALDRDGNGRITNGRELFGRFTREGSPNGIDALQKLAMETNGGVLRHSVSAEDPLYARLVLWTDRNHDGLSDPSELSPASDLASDIGLGYWSAAPGQAFTDRVRFRGWFHIRTGPGRNRVTSSGENDARTRYMYEVFLEDGARDVKW